ncbi:MAG: hypothetical protein ACRBBR_08895 [Cellvibrionaceae bacterium]
MKMVFLFCVCFSLLACSDDKRLNVSPACEPLPVIGNYVFAKTKETDKTLKLPWPAYLIRRAKIDDSDKGCDYIHSLSYEYRWYKGKLYAPPESIEKGIHKIKEAFPVKVFYRGSGFISDIDNSSFERWKLDGSKEHKKFPLIWYPRYQWDDPEKPSELSVRMAQLDSVWGIKNTRYKSIPPDVPFTAYCSIPPLDKDNPESRLENNFAKYGDSKCRGWINARKGDVYITFMVDVWAFKGDYKNHHPISEINHIYDALVEEFQSYIQE